MPTKEEMHNLVQDIMDSHEARAAGIASLQQEVRGHLRGAQSQLRGLGRNRQDMSRHLRTDLARGRATFSRGESQRKTEVNGWLNEVYQTHQTMAHQLQADLARGRTALSDEEVQRKAAVTALLDHVAAERAAGQKEWRRLVCTMAGKRNGAPVTEELAALGNRVFQYLANHPDGVRLTEIEGEFGLGRLQAGRVMRHLMDEVKAEKRDFCYFAT